MARAARPAAVQETPAVNPVAAEMMRKNQHYARVLVLGPVLKQDLTTGQQSEVSRTLDIEQASWGKDVITPPFDPLVLSMLPENCKHTQKCLDVMITNIDGFGYGLKCINKKPEDQIEPAILAQILQERVRMKNWFRNCVIGSTFLELRKQTRRDIEQVGYCGWEVVRNVKGDMLYLTFLPGHTIRLTPRSDMVVCDQKIIEEQVDGSRKIVTRKVMRKFRRFQQMDMTGTTNQKVWFKEFGDPRVLNCETGEFETPNRPVPPNKRANEIIFWRRHAPRTPYGIPRYIGVLLSMYGDRAAGEVNYVTLRNNNIPSMMIMVSNGQLTDASVARLEQFVATQIQGSDNFSRFIIVEAEPTGETVDGTDAGTMKMHVEKLTDQQIRDAMFLEYGDANRRDIREAWRLPPIFVGGADDYTRATADSSRRLADEQVFDPERRAFDDMINALLMPEFGCVYHDFASLGLNVTNDQDIIQIMAAGEKSGGMTPRRAGEMISDIFGKELSPLDPSIQLDVPYSYQMAQAVKNLTGTLPGVTPGETVTALKRLNPQVGEFFETLLNLREELDLEMTTRLEKDAAERSARRRRGGEEQRKKPDGKKR